MESLNWQSLKKDNTKGLRGRVKGEKKVFFKKELTKEEKVDTLVNARLRRNASMSEPNLDKSIV
jgi:hypothetical protein